MFTRVLTKSLKYVGMWRNVEQNGIKWGLYKGRSITHISLCRQIDSNLTLINSNLFGM